MSTDRASRAVARLMEIMAILRSPGGCPWDIEQTPATLRRYLVEETYEVLEALDAGDSAAIREELGDLLLQIVFQARIFEERGDFSLAEVADGIAEKLVRRHPHVFAGGGDHDPASLAASWERIKAEEKKAGSRGTGPSSSLDGIPPHLPALRQARKLAEKAARVGFESPAAADSPAALEKELALLEQAIREGDREAQETGFGTLFFALARLAHRLDLDAEDSLRREMERFRHCFARIEAAARRDGHSLPELSDQEREALWVKVTTADPRQEK